MHGCASLRSVTVVMLLSLCRKAVKQVSGIEGMRTVVVMNAAKTKEIMCILWCFFFFSNSLSYNYSYVGVLLAMGFTFCVLSYIEGVRNLFTVRVYAFLEGDRIIT